MPTGAWTSTFNDLLQTVPVVTGKNNFIQLKITPMKTNTNQTEDDDEEVVTVS